MSATTTVVARSIVEPVSVLGDTYERIDAADPVLLAQLWDGDERAHRNVARLLRVARPDRLRVLADRLIEVVVACPEVQTALRETLTALDPAFAHGFFRCVARRSPRPALTAG